MRAVRILRRHQGAAPGGHGTYGGGPTAAHQLPTALPKAAGPLKTSLKPLKRHLEAMFGH